MGITKRALGFLGAGALLVSAGMAGLTASANADDDPLPPPPHHPRIDCAVGFDPHMPGMVMGGCFGEGAFILRALCPDPAPHTSSPIHFRGNADTFVLACLHGPTWAKVYTLGPHGEETEVSSASVAVSAE
ncbi:hypothetical protein [Actinokineospora enzanensis]|uniref:hypothetical protein n=1 Tax=Actinokineospora enzanensis TaxID=155975 RepID=UPI0003817263|nr:hypothetical protein [Actinokineospora enzanensis]